MKEDENAVLTFARQEAGDLPVRLEVRKRASDGFEVRKTKQDYAITGNNARSCLYGVYHVRDGGRSGKFSTDWKIRGLYPCETLNRHSPEQMRRLIDRMGKWRFNTFVAYTHYGYREHIALIEEECAKRGIDVVYYYNTSFQFMRELDPARHFAKDAAGKPYSDTLMCVTRPCFADRAVERTIRKAVERFFRGGLPRHHRTLLFAPADGVQVCRCPSCRRLTPMEQWEIVQRAINASMRRHADDRVQWSQIYLHRYRPPAELSSYERVDRIFFDTHQRNRWYALGEEHPGVAENEAEVDWSAQFTPENVYLLDRVGDWRRRARKPVVIFENLMVQGTFSCGQFNTGVLIRDLGMLRERGVDGMLYEAFEPGMESFAPEFGHLAKAMWDGRYRHTPSDVESYLASRMTRPEGLDPKVRGAANTIVSVLPDFPWAEAERELGSVHAEHLRRFGRFWLNVTPDTTAAVVDHVYAHKERFDCCFIGFACLRRLFQGTGIAGLTPEETRFLSYWKLWDYMEEQAHPREAVDALVLSIRKKL